MVSYEIARLIRTISHKKKIFFFLRNRFVEVNVYGGANSAINSVPLSDTSFAHRDSLLNFQVSQFSPTKILAYFLITDTF